MPADLFQLEGAIEAVNEKETNDGVVTSLQTLKEEVENKLTSESKQILQKWDNSQRNVQQGSVHHKDP